MAPSLAVRSAAIFQVVLFVCFVVVENEEVQPIRTCRARQTSETSELLAPRARPVVRPVVVANPSPTNTRPIRHAFHGSRVQPRAKSPPLLPPPFLFLESGIVIRVVQICNVKVQRSLSTQGEPTSSGCRDSFVPTKFSLPIYTSTIAKVDRVGEIRVPIVVFDQVGYISAEVAV